MFENMPSKPVDCRQVSMMDFVTLDEDYGDTSEFDLGGDEIEEDKDEAELRRGPGLWNMVM